MERDYDENIATNPFFLSLKRNFPSLYTLLGNGNESGNAQLCVPKSSLLKRKTSSWTENDFRSHIIIGSPETEENSTGSRLKTLTGRAVKFESDSLLLLSADENATEQQIPILFEETFVSELGTSFRVVCLDGILSTDDVKSAGSGPTSRGSLKKRRNSELSSTRDSVECFELILFKASPNGSELKDRVTKMLQHFGGWLSEQFRPFGHYSSAQLAEVVSQQFCSIWDFIKYRRQEDGDVVTERQLELLKTGTEIFFFHHLHKPIWSILTSLMIEADGQFNRRVCDAERVTVEQLGVDTFLYESISAAGQELRLLNEESSPHVKMVRLRKTIQTIWKSAKAPHVLAPDNLLPVLIFLIAKSPLHNWISNLEYLRRFHFCDAAIMDELGYCCASFEAAVHFIDSGRLQEISMEKFIPSPQEILTFDTFGAGNVGPADVSTAESGVWEALLEAIRADSDVDIRMMFGGSERVELQPNDCAEDIVSTETKCHPLCTCQLCRPQNPFETHRPNINATVKGGRTALHLAAFLGKGNVLNALCELGANPVQKDAAGRTPLHYACASPSSSQKCVLLLLHHGAQPLAVDAASNTPLHLAVRHKNVDCAKALIFYNPSGGNNLSEAHLDHRNDDGDSALHIASRLRYYEIVEFLLQSGAKTSLYNKKGEKAIDYAEETAVLLNLFHKKFQGVAASDGLSFHSVPRGAQGIISDGIEAGEDLVDNHTKQMLISEAMEETLLRRFMRAVTDNDVPMVKFYLERSVSSLEGRCHPLCQCQKCSANKNANPEDLVFIDVNGCLDETSPLHLACSVPASPEMLELLISYGADVNLPCGIKSSTPLQQAVQSGASLNLVDLLLSHGASALLTDGVGKNSLHYAAEYTSSADVMKRLIEEVGVDNVDLPDRTGNTSLHYAAKSGNPEVISLLLSAGANEAVQNDVQLAPLDIAQGKAAIQLLRSPSDNPVV